MQQQEGAPASVRAGDWALLPLSQGPACGVGINSPLLLLRFIWLVLIAPPHQTVSEQRQEVQIGEGLPCVLQPA